MTQNESKITKIEGFSQKIAAFYNDGLRPSVWFRWNRIHFSIKMKLLEPFLIFVVVHTPLLETQRNSLQIFHNSITRRKF
jgi:hypothetical protein